MRVSQQKFAELAGVTPKAVRKARQAGRLVAIVGGTDLDTEAPLNQAFLALHRPGAAMLPGDAQIGALVAKAALIQHRLEQDEASYIDRAEMTTLWQENARELQRRLTTFPVRHARQVAATLGCDVATARRILERFAPLLSAEFAGFEIEARDAVERLH
jgi:hypothetical protein